MVDKGISLGMTAGIYTSHYNWETIVGLDYTYPHDKGLELWYAHYES